MNLLFPAYLAGLLALALPWLLHRFSDQRPQELSFPSKRFLEPTAPPVSRTRKLKYRVLLALRVLSLLLLCMLFAQPWIASQGSSGSQRMHHLVVIDQSLSMRAGDRWDMALEQARDIIDEIPEPDTMELIGFERTVHRLADDSESVAAVTQALSAMQPGYAAADYGTLMQHLDSLAADAEVPVRLWLISDEQKSAMPAQLNALYAPRIAQMTARSVVSGLQRNVHLRAAASSRDGVNVQLSAQLLSSVSVPHGENAGSATGTDAQAVTVQVSSADQLLAEQQTTLVPGELKSLVFDQLILPPSSNPQLQVSLREADALSVDNRVDVVVRTDNPMPVTLLHSERAVSANAAVFLATAMETDSLARVDIMEGNAERVPPDTQHLVTGRDLQTNLGIDVLNFVDRGSNALVFRSDRTGQPESPSLQGSEMGAVDESHALSLGDMDWAGARFFEVAPLALFSGDRVLLQTSEQQPILVERATARGRLMILNDRLDGEGSNLPLQPAFVTLMQSILRYFDANTALPDQVVVGSRFVLPANVQVLDPAGQPLLSLDASARSGAIELDEPGMYSIVGVRGEHSLRVVLDAEEADLTLVEADQMGRWQARHSVAASGQTAPDGSTVDSERQAATSPLLAQGPNPSGVALWYFILPLLLLFLLLESGFANRRLDVRRDGS
ncbi:MAG: VWA domain-containing protein [Granulosicoccus sp.]|nr:VWA domain-containing protein [Granulosicoccus sp.]